MLAILFTESKQELHRYFKGFSKKFRNGGF